MASFRSAGTIAVPRRQQLVGGVGLTCALVVASILVAYGGARDLRLFAAAGVLVCLPFVVYAAFLWPLRALPAGFVLVLIAATKFRGRSATASLEGDADSQVKFELAMYAFLGLVVVLAYLRHSRAVRRLRPVELILLSYALLALCSTLWSPSRALTLVRAAQQLILLCLAVLSVRLMSPSRLLRALSGAVLAYVLICSTLSLAFPWAGGGLVDFGEGQRFSWFAMHPIAAATLIGIASLLTLSVIVFGPRGWRERRFGLPLALYMVPLTGLLIAANSRGPSAAFLAGAGALLVRKHLRVWTVLALIAFSVALLVLFASKGETMADLLTRIASTDPRVAELILRGQSVRDLEGFSGRTDVWRAAWPLLVKHPVLGVGFQGSRAALLAAVPWASYAHNALLQTLLDLGVLGAVLLWGSLVYCLVVTCRPIEGLSREAVWCQASAFSAAVYLTVNSVTFESFAAAPGFDLLLLLVCILIANQTRAPAVATDPQRPSVRSAGRTYTPQFLR
ncbi:MAG TPA: O-antigen ligase family protein [Gemmatimonadales bacterium]|nr:O-antigen ligase family protein [Gemmatimonadales bacterium]